MFGAENERKELTLVTNEESIPTAAKKRDQIRSDQIKSNQERSVFGTGESLERKGKEEEKRPSKGYVSAMSTETLMTEVETLEILSNETKENETVARWIEMRGIESKSLN